MESKQRSTHVSQICAYVGETEGMSAYLSNEEHKLLVVLVIPQRSDRKKPGQKEVGTRQPGSQMSSKKCKKTYCTIEFKTQPIM